MASRSPGIPACRPKRHPHNDVMVTAKDGYPTGALPGNLRDSAKFLSMADPKQPEAGLS